MHHIKSTTAAAEAEHSSGSASNRRTLLVVAASVGAAVALVDCSPSPSVAEVQAKQPSSEKQGYRLSAHVKRYYETARI